jgi:hypothetical protein
MPLRDGDGLWQQVGVAVDLALLGVQAGSCPVGDIFGEPTPDKSRRHKMPRGEPLTVGKKSKPNGAAVPAKWGQKHETMRSQEVCGLSTIEKHDLHKNCGNV